MREGLKETLTITRFGISCQRALGRTLGSTNAIESMLSICRERARNVKRWRGGEGRPKFHRGRDTSRGKRKAA